MPGLTYSVFAAILLFSRFVLVSAWIYGTSPIASTVWEGGRMARVSWVDDKHHPLLQDIAEVDVDLMSGNELFVASLGQGVNPTLKFLDVWVSPAWGHNSSDYYVRFTSAKPPSTVYTSYFTIIDMAAAAALHQNTSSSTLSQTSNTTSAGSSTPPSTGISMYTPHLTLVLPGTTVTSALAPRPTTVQPTPTASAVTDKDEDEFEEHDAPQEFRQVAAKSMNGADGGFDLERMKFRMVFILWPTLVGILLAL